MIKFKHEEIREIQKGLFILEDSLNILKDELLEKQSNYINKKNDYKWSHCDQVQFEDTLESLNTIYDIYKKTAPKNIFEMIKNIK